MRISIILVGTFIGCVSSVSLGQASRPADKPRLAIIDFCIKGDVGIKDAGEVVSERLLMQMGQDRYQLVERSQLAALLKEIDLTIALVRDNPEKVYGKLKGIRFIVLGSVNKLGSIAISARLVNVATGDIVQTAEVLARDAQGLEDALGELAKVLLMTEQEKKDYLGKRPIATLPSAKEKELVLDLGNNVTMKLALIPAGKFIMGSPDSEKDRSTAEGPQREVTISKPFYMGVFEVTQEQYEQVMGKNPSAFKGAKNPVETVSWEDAVEFCKKLSAKTGKTVSLPTEAQWEYACRAGTKTRFGFGDADADLCKYGNYCDKSNTNGFLWQDKDHNDGFDKTAPVGSLKPNNWGLYDMHGNVWESCSDWFADSYANAKNQDPQGPGRGTDRVLRGGSWSSNPRECRSAGRVRLLPGIRFDYYGFRVAVASDNEALRQPPAAVSAADTGLTARQAKARELLAKGKALLDDKKFNEASAAFQAAKDLDPDLVAVDQLLANSSRMAVEKSASEAGILSRLERRNEIARQAALVDISKQVLQAREILNAATKETEYNNAEQAARSALDILQANKSFFGAKEYSNEDARIRDLLAQINSRREAFNKFNKGRTRS